MLIKKKMTLVLSVLLAISSVGMAQSGGEFAKANQEFASGDFDGATRDYEDLVRAGQDTPNLFYNLGNAYFRKKDFGRAILNYERALALDRHHPEAQANLRVARDEARALELLPNRMERVLAFVSPNQYATTSVIAFWLGTFGIVAFIFNSRRSRGLMALSILSLAVFGAAAFATWELEQGKNGRGLAIVIADNADARLATADTSNRVLALPAGSEVRVLIQRGDWVYATLPDNLRGWLPASSAEQVRM